MEHAELLIEGKRHRIVRVRGRESLGDSFRYEITCERTSDSSSPAELVGGGATIVLRDRFGSERLVAGIVGSARRSFTDTREALIELTVVPRASALEHSSDHRTFRDVTRIAVLSEVAREGGVDLRVEVTEPGPTIPCIAQYDETDQAFFERLLAEDGHYAWFDHDQGSTLVVSDDSRSAPFVLGAPVLRIHDGKLGVHAHETVSEPRRKIRASTNAISVVGADRDGRPGAPRSYQEGIGSGTLHAVVYAGSSHGRLDAKTHATHLLDRTAKERDLLTSETTSVRPYPGRCIELEGGATDGAYLVTDVAVEVDQHRRGDTGGVRDGARFSISMIPRSTRLRAAPKGPPPVAPGLQIAEARGPSGQDVAVEGDGRVLAKLRWDRSERDVVHPLRVAQRATADSFSVPRPGFSIVALAERGRLDEATAIGRLFDAEHPPPYALPADKTRTVYKTATSPGDGTTNEIAFEGAAGREEMFVHAAGSMRSASNGRDTERVEGNALRDVAGDEAAAVADNDTLAVEGSLTLEIGGDETLRVHGDQAASADGSRIETIGGARFGHTGKSHTTKVDKKRRLSVGLASIETTLGIHATESTAGSSCLVGGVKVQVAAGGISESATLASSLLVGGAKLDLAGGTIEVKTKAGLKENVGGAMILSAGESFSWKVQDFAAMMAASASVRAEDITIAATTRILILVGKSSIYIDAEGVEIRGTAVDASGSTWEAISAPQTHFRPPTQ